MPRGEFQTLSLLNGRLFWNQLRTLYQHSWLKIGFCAFMFFSLAAGAFWLFKAGFDFMTSFPLLGPFLVDRFLYIFTYCLFMLLAASSVATAYLVLYRSEDNVFLFTLPISWETLWIQKMFDIFMWSAWAVLFLAFPFLLAYGRFKGAAISFYFLSPLLFIGMAWLACLAGAFLNLLFFFLIRSSEWRKNLIRIGIAAGLFYLLYLGKQTLLKDTVDTPVGFFNRILPHFKMSFNPLLPHAWTAEAVIDLASGSPRFFPFLLLFSHGLFLFQAGFLLSPLLYRKSCFVLTETQNAERQPREGKSFLRSCVQYLPGFPSRWKPLIVKDIRLFLRDPSQWAQFLIFFGVLAIYFSNIKSLNYDYLPVRWKNFVYLLNIVSLLVTQASLNGRFVFPMFSLEGNRFWIVGLSPLTMGEVLMEKFLLCSSFNLLIMWTLTGLAGCMMRVSPFLLGCGFFFTTLGAFALTGITLGMGAIFPDFKTDNPLKVISGFSGTLTFMLELLYIIAMTGLFALLVGQIGYLRGIFLFSKSLSCGILGGAFLLSFICAFLPLLIARKRLKSFEY